MYFFDAMEIFTDTPPPGYMSEDGDSQEQNGTENMGITLEVSYHFSFFIILAWLNYALLITSLDMW